MMWNMENWLKLVEMHVIRFIMTKLPWKPWNLGKKGKETRVNDAEPWAIPVKPTR